MSKILSYDHVSECEHLDVTGAKGDGIADTNPSASVLVGPDDPDIAYEDTMTEDDRTLQLLIEAVQLFEDLNKGKVLAARAEHIEKVAELTGVQPVILTYAFKFGTLKAHKLFTKKESRSVGTGSADEKPVDPMTT